MQLDIYAPTVRDKNTAIIFIHGGGFRAGSKEDMADHAKHYAKQGFVSTTINYRLSLDSSYPAAVNDATDALNWMVKKAAFYGYNPNKIVLVGYSAGGTLALNVGLDHSNHVAAIIDVAGITDIAALAAETTIPELKEDIGRYMGKNDPTLASPLNYVNEKSPPVLIFHGDKDTIIPISQSTALANSLKNHNVPTKLSVYTDVGHEIMLPNKKLGQLLTEMTEFIISVEADPN